MVSNVVEFPISNHVRSRPFPAALVLSNDRAFSKQLEHSLLNLTSFGCLVLNCHLTAVEWLRRDSPICCAIIDESFGDPLRGLDAWGIAKMLQSASPSTVIVIATGKGGKQKKLQFVDFAARRKLLGGTRRFWKSFER